MPRPDTALPPPVELGDGRVLDVRPVSVDDIDGLAELYAGLETDDLYRRFFSGFRPGRAFLMRVATAAERGGLGLVATVGARGGSVAPIVAEADYVALPNGNGELAMVVTREWRGWLGPYLLDCLLRCAAEQGVQNLEADVLSTNAPMLALLRSRGWAFADRSDAAATRLVVSTAGRVPGWPPSDHRARLLIESVGACRSVEQEAQNADLDVLTCPGPAAGRTCPMLDGGTCPLADGADAIVMSPAAHDERWQELRAGHRRAHPDTPVLPYDLSGSSATRAQRGAARENLRAFLRALGRSPDEPGDGGRSSASRGLPPEHEDD